MKLSELKAQIDRLVEEDPYRADATVTFGPENVEVQGGIMAKSRKTGLVILQLAPLKLDQVGGF